MILLTKKSWPRSLAVKLSSTESGCDYKSWEKPPFVLHCMPGRTGLCPEQTCARLSLQADLHSFAQINPSGNVTPCTKMLSERTPVTPVVLQSSAETRSLRWKGWSKLWWRRRQEYAQFEMFSEMKFAEVSTQTTEEKILLQHMFLVCMLNYFCFNFSFFEYSNICVLRNAIQKTDTSNQNEICMRQGGFCAVFCCCCFVFPCLSAF